MSDSPVMEPSPKRRKVRKGTHSCWECKRRKVRCLLQQPGDDICIPCQKRGLKCIGQDLEPPLTMISPVDSGAKLRYCEALLNKLSHEVGHIRPVASTTRPTTTTTLLGTMESLSPVQDEGLPTPASLVAELTPAIKDASSRSDPSDKQDRLQAYRSHHQIPLDPLVVYSATFPRPLQDLPPNLTKNERLSACLLAALPSPPALCAIEAEIPAYAWMCFGTNFISRSDLDRGASPLRLFDVDLLSCTISTHPLLIASKMLDLAAGMLFIPSDVQLEASPEPLKSTLHRISETAISLVSADETMLCSIEGLICIMREGYFHLSAGHLRRAWIAFRRANTVGHLMNLHRKPLPALKKIHPETRQDVGTLWFRIVYIDRFISLLLGLPHANSQVDRKVKADLADMTPADNLEWEHCRIALKLLERNQVGVTPETHAMAMQLDRDLIAAADQLPNQFWRHVNWTGIKSDSVAAFNECVRTRDQVTHYSLLNQLHLPFLLGPNEDQNSYSKAACITASREILTRVSSFRVFNPVAACCRMSEFLALIAGLTLMLCHIDGHCRRVKDNILIHQRLSDRSIIEQALDSMEEISRFSEDALAAKCADVLRHLLHVEADAARGQRYSAEKVQDNDVSSVNDHDALYISVPYFPTIKIARQGVAVRRASNGVAVRARRSSVTVGGLGSVQIGGEVPRQSPSGADDHTRSELSHAVSMATTGPSVPIERRISGQGAGFTAPPPAPIVEMAGLFDPEGLSLGDESGLQGMDMAFLDNLTWTTASHMDQSLAHFQWH